METAEVFGRSGVWCEKRVVFLKRTCVVPAQVWRFDVGRHAGCVVGRGRQVCDVKCANVQMSSVFVTSSV